MKRTLKKLLALSLSAAVCVGLLAGCGSFSASDLVKSNLDFIYLDQYTDDYLKKVDLTKEEAHQQYEQGIQMEVQAFASYFNIDLDLCDSSISDEIADLYHQIYPHSTYEVGETSTSGETYLVSLTIYPMDIIDQAMAHSTEFGAAWQERINNGEFGDATEKQYEEAWANAIIDLVSAQLDSIGYLDPQTISVQVTKDEDGVYGIDSGDFQRIDILMIDYSAS